MDTVLLADFMLFLKLYGQTWTEFNGKNQGSAVYGNAWNSQAILYSDKFRFLIVRLVFYIDIKSQNLKIFFLVFKLFSHTFF